MPSARASSAARTSARAAKTKLLAFGAESAPSPSAELAMLLKNDSAKWAKVVRSKNTKAD